MGRLTSTHSPGPFDQLSPLHVPLLLQDNRRQEDTPENREWLCKHSGFAYKICIAVPNMLFKNPPQFLDAEGNPMDEKTRKWEQEDGSHVWREIVKADTMHGWAIVDETRVEMKFSYYLGKKAQGLVYSSPHVREVARDAEGNILEYNIEFDLPMVTRPQTSSNQQSIKFTLTADKVQHVESNPQKDHLGIGKLSKCWSHIIFAEWISYLTVYVDCYLKPLLFFPMPPNTPSGTKDAIQSQIEQLPLLKALTGEFDQAGQSYKPEWIASAMETKFQEHLQVQLSMIAADAELPQRFLVGTQEGATASSKEDALGVQEAIEAIFKQYEPFIRFWCERHGVIKPGENVTIDPDVEIRLSERDQEEIEGMRAYRATMLTKIISINEARAILNMAPTEGGDEVLGINEAKPLIPENVNVSGEKNEEKPNAKQTRDARGAESAKGEKE